ncbi:MAG: hypothetical protein H6667_02325 [Ardenticatenaceae bacterium]|nr:hypothetical protein [Ardenticatenaceae bacterium]MCB9443346.1 hypothetical protein [Ardenticatenaceae bacterium]
MSYHDTVKTLAEDAEQLEQVYQAAAKAGKTAVFHQAINASHEAEPDNLLYAAWFYRLQYAASQAKHFAIAWGWVIPLALLNGLLFWWLSDDKRYMIEIVGAPQGINRDFLPAVILFAAPLSAVCVLIYLTAVSRKNWQLSALISLIMIAAGAYVFWTYPQAGTRPFQEQYLNLMAIHLPLLAWAGVGVYLIFGRWDTTNRVSFLIKSIEVFGLGGVMFAILGLFTGITFSLFAALDVEVPVIVQRLFLAGGGGLLPVVAVAIIYNPTLPPASQKFDNILYRLAAYLLRVLLLLSLVVLIVYLGFIPFNFQAPFANRDVLITYNVMLFAIIALLLGVTFVDPDGKTPAAGRWLRIGINAIAVLTLIISLYALSAIVYRTIQDRLTPNRLAFTGWNVVNIIVLLLILLLQMRREGGDWLNGIHRAFSVGTIIYSVWTVLVILAIPWLFGIDQGEIEKLPTSVQELIFQVPNPILVKCTTSPHIYLLDQGEKRWIEDIETFNDRGYVWRDIHFISCGDLRSLPDGTPIPADAGPPPQP